MVLAEITKTVPLSDETRAGAAVTHGRNEVHPTDSDIFVSTGCFLHASPKEQVEWEFTPKERGSTPWNK